MTQTREIVDLIDCDENIKNVLIICEFKEIDEFKLAKILDFNEDEINKLKLLWLPVYSEGWIYLSDEIILTQMTNEKGKNTIEHFVNRKLLECYDYKENIDYKNITKNDDLIKIYESFYSPNLSNRKTSNRKKYYAITGDTYEDLLMKSTSKEGKNSRKLYRKVIKLAQFMKDYIHGLHQYIGIKREQELQTQLDSKNKEIDEQKLITTNIQNFINNTKPLDKNTTLYIVTTKNYAKENIFKPGSINGVEEKQLKSRLATYNTGRIDTDKFYYCYVKTCYAATDLDHQLKKLLQFCKHNKKKEMCILHYDGLVEIIDFIEQNHSEGCEFVNDFIKNKNIAYMNKKPVIPPPIIIGIPVKLITLIESVDNVESNRNVIDVSDISEDDRKEKIKEALNIFIRHETNTPEYNCSEYDLSDSMSIKWKEIQKNLVMLLGGKKPKWIPWRKNAKEIVDNISNMNFKIY
jgi:hypothetical protein